MQHRKGVMKTRCKFQVDRVTKFQGNCEEVTLNAVYGTNDENKCFAQATPSGKLVITVTNPDVIGKMIPGQYYYVDLIPCEVKE